MKLEHVDGKNTHKVMLYALSTCIWCRKTKDLLTKLGVAFDYAYIDLVPKDEQGAALDEVKKYNPGCNFPTVVIDDKKVIVGFKEKELQEALA